MNTSLILQRFSKQLKNPKVLKNPEEFLGPNTEKVLEFCLKIEKMPKEQLRVVEEREEDFFNENYSEWDKAIDLVIEASKELVGEKYAIEVSWAALTVTYFWAACYATREIIGGVENPVFLKMFDNL